MKNFDNRNASAYIAVMTVTASSPAPLAVRLWLLLCAALIVAMIVIGGYTRLNNAGLSIVEWAPVTGTIPPLSAESWAAEFAKYQQSPEYQKINKGMTLEEFKEIYWPEYIHRLWGRLIGVAFIVPLLFFWWRGHLTQRQRLALLGIFALGGLQGLLGWLMVRSGLQDMPYVSSYKLAMHLGLALLIYALIIWSYWSLSLAPRYRHGVTKAVQWGWLPLIVLTLFYGAKVAGLDGGMVYNSFPLMGGQWLPSDFWSPSLGWLSVLENPVAVQFIHRWLGVLLFLVSAGFWLYTRKHEELPERTKFWSSLLALAVTVQMLIGIKTLLLQVPWVMGVAHQLGAVFVLTCATALLHSLTAKKPT